jgi:hypothetical protein
MNGTSKKEKILVYLKANPSKSTIQVAKALGVRKEYVYNIKSAEGLTKTKAQPINGAMEKAITSALVDTKPAAKSKKITKQEVVAKKSMSVNLQIQMEHGTLIMSMAEAGELYGVLKPLMRK